MKTLIANWRNLLPTAVVAAIAAGGALVLFRKKPEDSDVLERDRRVYLNRVGRIVEGHILEVVDHSEADHAAKAQAKPVTARRTSLLGRRSVMPKNGAQKLLYYSYSISGVTYETAQDVTGLEEQAHLKRIAVGQTASVKYDPSNPSNSILLADDWSGIR
ncbi:MAG TPA: hypothetical protein VFW94_12700 [Candidatus Acidoferrales bacterium]|nr:hypothetical protein [Candidatus Acidoferrales bacterium]